MITETGCAPAAAVSAAGLTLNSATSTPAFNPYRSDAAFYLGAYIFEDVGVSKQILVSTQFGLQLGCVICVLAAGHSVQGRCTGPSGILASSDPSDENTMLHSAAAAVTAVFLNAVANLCHSSSWHWSSRGRPCISHQIPAVPGIWYIVAVCLYVIEGSSDCVCAIADEFVSNWFGIE